MDRPKGYVSFSSFIEEERYFTQVDMITEVIKVSKKDEVIFNGSIKEFKELEKVKANNTDKVYSSILTMAESLMDILTKK